MQLSAIALAAILVLAGPQPELPQADPGVIEQIMIKPLHEAEVAAEEAGKITEMCVVEGQTVQKGQLLARVDDRMAKVQKELAEYKLTAAHAEAINQINVEFSKASNEVAKADYLGMLEANKSARKTYPETDLRKAKLDVTKTDLQITQAIKDLEIAGLKANVQQGELDAALLKIEQLKVLAPIDGVIVERHRNLGEWVRPGDPVVTVITLDRLLAKGVVDSTHLAPSDVKGRRVTVEVQLAHRGAVRFSGKVVLASPKFSDSTRYEVWAEVDNRQENDHWLLGYDMTARMTIHWQEAASSP
jgi:RND family efflux transporter MFP subunit